MKPVTIVGAGFSGLTLAFYLRKLGVPVRILESASRPGGLIQSRVVTYGLVETAANALLCNDDVENLMRELNVELAQRLPSRHRRYIFWKKVSRWPLSWLSTLRLILMLLRRRSWKRPRSGETIASWGRRVVDQGFADRLLVPALQGIYAADADRLSATLVLASRFQKPQSRLKRSAKSVSGSVAPKDGMGELIEKLTNNLRDSGVVIEYGTKFELKTLEEVTQTSEGSGGPPVVLCTSAWSAAEILQSALPELAQVLRSCESLPLVTVTAFFAATGFEWRGFGCLFPAQEKFHALGVLFNECIFAGRVVESSKFAKGVRSETWILGGAHATDIHSRSDQELLNFIRADRARLTSNSSAPLLMPLDSVVTRWPRALPHYTVEWEKTLASLHVPAPLYLHGNYLGSLGLSAILLRSKNLANQIKDVYAG